MRRSLQLSLEDQDKELVATRAEAAAMDKACAASTMAAHKDDSKEELLAERFRKAIKQSRLEYRQMQAVEEKEMTQALRDSLEEFQRGTSTARMGNTTGNGATSGAGSSRLAPSETRQGTQVRQDGHGHEPTTRNYPAALAQTRQQEPLIDPRPFSPEPYCREPGCTNPNDCEFTLLPGYKMETTQPPKTKPIATPLPSELRKRDALRTART